MRSRRYGNQEPNVVGINSWLKYWDYSLKPQNQPYGIIYVERGEHMQLTYREKLHQVGLNISFYRRYRNLTQMQLAEKVNISACYISQIERGLLKNSVSLPVLMAIADALGVEISKLFEFRELSKQKREEE